MGKAKKALKGGDYSLDKLSLAIVDLETTGSSAVYDRIIEIGIKRVERGRVVETYSTLVNPDQRIPEFIVRLTGIANADVEDAPPFSEVASRVHRLLQGCIFVAHNVRFDYGFLRNELERQGITFSAPCLCTVRLSRKLFPEHRHHNLTSLIERFNLTCENRHRALGDAEVVWSFLQHVRASIESEQLELALQGLLKTPSLPPQLVPEDIEALPNGPGVYIFYDTTGMPLYVGKSVTLRDRVRSHFSNDYRSGKEMRMCQQVSRIEARKTYGELGALLLESHLIKTLSPLHNRVSRIRRQLTAICRSSTKKGYDSVRIEDLHGLNATPYSDILGIFRSRRQAKECLYDLAREHRLCPKLLGLEQARRSCFYAQINQCTGACAGRETPVSYNARFSGAFANRRIRTWPYSGPILIEEAAPDRASGHVFVIDEWRLIESLAYTDEGRSCFLKADESFDYDSYKILARHLLRAGHRVKRVSRVALAGLLNPEFAGADSNDPEQEN